MTCLSQIYRYTALMKHRMSSSKLQICACISWYFYHLPDKRSNHCSCDNTARFCLIFSKPLCRVLSADKASNSRIWYANLYLKQLAPNNAASLVILLWAVFGLNVGHATFGVVRGHLGWLKSISKANTPHIISFRH